MHEASEEEFTALVDKFVEEKQTQNSNSHKDNLTRESLERRLKYTYFFVGGGAWQHIWNQSDSIGFSSRAHPKPNTPSTDDLGSSMRPEVLKRFRDEVIFLPPMSEEDYLVVSQAIESSLPKILRVRFHALVKRDLHKAVEQDLGMRFFERVLSQSLIETHNIEGTTL